MTRPCVPQIETCVHLCRGVLGGGTWGLESEPREKTDAGYEEIACGDGREEIHNWECLWTKARLS